MNATFAGGRYLDNFWVNFHGEETLQNAISYFVKNYPYTNSGYKEDFAINIIPKIIGKHFEKRRFLELLESELSKFDFSKIETRNSSTPNESIEGSSIFDADKLDGFAFESFVAKILRSNGFTDVQVTRGSGDQGGDILAKHGEEKLVIQAKRFSIDKKVTNSAVQEVVGAIAWYNANKGVVVTNSMFTRSAKELAERNNIELWDRQKVSEFIEVHNNSSFQKDLEDTKQGEVYDIYGENIQICKKCNYENSEESKICGKCGRVL
jgi:Holliday junction resolvase